MDARPEASSPVSNPRRPATFIIAVALVPILGGASHRSQNFVVDAPTPQMARAVADHAEVCRKKIAREWLGKLRGAMAAEAAQLPSHRQFIDQTLARG